MFGQSGGMCVVAEIEGEVCRWKFGEEVDVAVSFYQRALKAPSLAATTSGRRSNESEGEQMIPAIQDDFDD